MGNLVMNGIQEFCAHCALARILDSRPQSRACERE